nr:unnamed protein product [Callosobruchus chinensis]
MSFIIHLLSLATHSKFRNTKSGEVSPRQYEALRTRL